MSSKIIKLLKGIATSFAISLFFSTFFLFLIYIIGNEKISDTIFLVNRLLVTEYKAEEKEITFDSVKKKLARYPNYGEVWAHIVIPKLKVNAIVYNGDDLELLQTGTGHYTGSYFPGEGGTVLLAAHNSKEHFGGIPNLKKGEKIIIQATYGTYTYEVVSGKIEKAEDLENLEIQDQKEELILYTCYPVGVFGYKTDRFVIRAKLVGESHEKN